MREKQTRRVVCIKVAGWWRTLFVTQNYSDSEDRWENICEKKKKINSVGSERDAKIKLQEEK